MKGHANAQSPSAEVGVEKYQQGDYFEAIRIWEDLADNDSPDLQVHSRNEATIRKKLAKAYQMLGNGGEAVKNWKLAIAYEYAQDTEPLEILKLELELAQSYLTLGQPRQSEKLLCNLETEQFELDRLEGEQGIDRKPKIIAEDLTINFLLGQDDRQNGYSYSYCDQKSIISTLFSDDSIYGEENFLKNNSIKVYAETLRLLGGEENYKIAITLLSNTSLPQELKNQSFSSIYYNLAFLSAQRLSASLHNTDQLKRSNTEGRGFFCSTSINLDKAINSLPNQSSLTNNDNHQKNRVELLTSKLLVRLRLEQLEYALFELMKNSSEITDELLNDWNDLSKDCTKEFRAEKYKKKDTSLAENTKKIEDNLEVNQAILKNKIFDFSKIDSNTIRLKVNNSLTYLQYLEPISFNTETLKNPFCPDQSKVSNLEKKISEFSKRLEQKDTSSQEKIIDWSREESLLLEAKGHLQECRGDYKQAIYSTNQARTISGTQNRHLDILYLLDWQAARIYDRLGSRYSENSYQAYQAAVEHIDQIRNDILVVDKDLQFDVRDSIEPIYQKYIQISLEKALHEVNEVKQQSLIKNALNTKNKLNLTRLQNFYGDDCRFDIPQSSGLLEEKFLAEELQSNVAVISYFIDEDKPSESLGVLISKGKIHPPQKLSFDLRKSQNFTQSSQQKILKDNIEALKTAVSSRINKDKDFRKNIESQTLYNFLIKPFRNELNNNSIDTLVFLLDESLLGLPLEILQDEKSNQFLIQNFAIAYIPQLNVKFTTQKNLQKRNILLSGLSARYRVKGGYGSGIYGALGCVRNEIYEIFQFLNTQKIDHDILLTFDPNAECDKGVIDTDSLIYFQNSDYQDFSYENLKVSLNELQPSILHIATHALFGPTKENRFLLFNETQGINIRDLERIFIKHQNLNQPSEINLLILTACETATGDQRSVLGLAGVGLQSGINASIASLWQVDDQSTYDLSKLFYEDWITSEDDITNLDKEMSKAKALQKVKNQFIQNKKSPYYWAPFILIGDWH